MNEQTIIPKKKPSSFRKALCFWLLSFFWIGIGVLIGSTFLKTDTSDIPSHNTNVVSPIKDGNPVDVIGTKLKTLQEIIDKYYYYTDETDITQSMNNVYKAYVAGLGDKYSEYYSKSELEETLEGIQGTYCGIGAVVAQGREGEVVIVEPYPDSPAQEAGLLSGDIVLKIDGKDLTGVTLNDAVALVKGEEGTKTILTISREGETLEVEVERRPVGIPSVYSEKRDGNVGYIQIASFDIATTEQFKKAVDDLLSQGVSGLVFDLRNNGGGALDTAVAMLDYLLPEELLVYVEDKYKNRQNYNSDEACIDENVPIALIINDKSASASEVFAGALQDCGRAKLFGTKSFGKGVVQNLITLSDGSGIKITTSMYFTPLGRNFNGNGIDPDVLVELPTEESAYDEYGYLKQECDTQLQAALDYITGQKK